MKPYKTQPILKEKIWGGQRLIDYNKNIKDRYIGESWEVDLCNMYISVLVKFIDANDTLSVQVHPNDDYAINVEKMKNGKTEMWIILDCEQDSQIVYGFKRAICKSTLKKALTNGNLSELLNYVKVKKGDCILIPSGTVHTLGKGILAYEIQQPSDLTYRLYDWNRIDVYGNKRELHIKNALEAINYSNKLVDICNIYDNVMDNSNSEIKIADNNYFSSKYVSVEKHRYIDVDTKKTVLFSLISGSAYLYWGKEKYIVNKGDTWIIPYDYRNKPKLFCISNAQCIITNEAYK